MGISNYKIVLLRASKYIVEYCIIIILISFPSYLSSIQQIKTKPFTMSMYQLQHGIRENVDPIKLNHSTLVHNLFKHQPRPCLQMIIRCGPIRHREWAQKLAVPNIFWAYGEKKWAPQIHKCYQAFCNNSIIERKLLVLSSKYNNIHKIFRPL